MKLLSKCANSIWWLYFVTRSGDYLQQLPLVTAFVDCLRWLPPVTASGDCLRWLPPMNASDDCLPWLPLASYPIWRLSLNYSPNRPTPPGDCIWSLSHYLLWLPLVTTSSDYLWWLPPVTTSSDYLLWLTPVTTSGDSLWNNESTCLTCYLFRIISFWIRSQKCTQSCKKFIKNAIIF